MIIIAIWMILVSLLLFVTCIAECHFRRKDLYYAEERFESTLYSDTPGKFSDWNHLVYMTYNSLRPPSSCPGFKHAKSMPALQTSGGNVPHFLGFKAHSLNSLNSQRSGWERVSQDGNVTLRKAPSKPTNEGSLAGSRLSVPRRQQRSGPSQRSGSSNDKSDPTGLRMRSDTRQRSGSVFATDQERMAFENNETMIDHLYPGDNRVNLRSQDCECFGCSDSYRDCCQVVDDAFRAVPSPTPTLPPLPKDVGYGADI